MEPSGSIGTNGYYCPSAECSVANGAQFQLNYAGARAIRALTVCWYEILSARCSRCGLRFNALDPSDNNYHTQPGGCR
jgi:hypothetical protein